LGILALILIIIGVALTAITNSASSEKVMARDIIFLVITTIGYWLYSAFPKTINASAQSLFLPQTLGIFIGASLYILFTKRLYIFTQKATWVDLVAGVFFGIGAYSYIISAQINGVTNAFIYSQLSVIISTIGGMTILREYKHGRELVTTLVGLALIIIGAII
ncbi:GRP family sugar transporter, partial [Lactobacillus kitasatonis]|uniref:GRP family sugar transporter n=1 Tax=Lactobacillus kitasatonis TaxID=237446 RepID=UPI0026EDCADE